MYACVPKLTNDPIYIVGPTIAIEMDRWIDQLIDIIYIYIYLRDLVFPSQEWVTLKQGMVSVL